MLVVASRARTGLDRRCRFAASCSQASPNAGSAERHSWQGPQTSLQLHYATVGITIGAQTANRVKPAVRIWWRVNTAWNHITKLESLESTAGSGV